VGGWSGCVWTNESRDAAGRLVVSGKVSSPWLSTLTSSFDDFGFSPGTLDGDLAPRINGALPPPGVIILIALFVIGLICCGGGCAASYRTRLKGSLFLSRDGERTERVPMPWAPVLLRRTRPLIGLGGVLLVYRLPDHHMRVRLWFTDRRTLADDLAPGDKRSLIGVDIEHVRHQDARCGARADGGC
jgi:hypothetical protein